MVNMKPTPVMKTIHLGYTSNIKIDTIPMHSSAQCANNPYLKYWFTKNMTCGGKRGRDTCLGESGGPLVAEVDGKFTLIGVTSWGVGKG